MPTTDCTAPNRDYRTHSASATPTTSAASKGRLRRTRGRSPNALTTYRDRHHAGIHANPNADTGRTVTDLKTALKALGQATSGTKAELEQRLADAQKNA